MDSASALQCDLQKPTAESHENHCNATGYTKNKRTHRQVGNMVERNERCYIYASWYYIYIWKDIEMPYALMYENISTNYMNDWNKYIDSVESHLKNHSNRAHKVEEDGRLNIEIYVSLIEFEQSIGWMYISSNVTNKAQQKKTWTSFGCNWNHL